MHRTSTFPLCKTRTLAPFLVSSAASLRHKHIGRPAEWRTVIRLVPVHPRGIAILAVRSHHERIAEQSYAATESVVGSGIGGLEIGLLAPDPARVKT